MNHTQNSLSGRPGGNKQRQLILVLSTDKQLKNFPHLYLVMNIASLLMKHRSSSITLITSSRKLHDILQNKSAMLKSMDLSTIYLDENGAFQRSILTIGERKPKLLDNQLTLQSKELHQITPYLAVYSLENILDWGIYPLVWFK